MGRDTENPKTTELGGWRDTALSRRFGLRLPIIQGAFGGFRSQALTATVSRFGGLGSFGAHGLEPAAIREVIAELRTLTDKPFAMNLWVSMEDAGATSSDEAAFLRSRAALEPLFTQLGAALPARTPHAPLRFEDQARAIIDAKAPVFSFIFGVPPREILDECRRQGIRTIGTATTPDEARALAEAGVDAVVASGFESGGHRGSFLGPAQESLMGTFALVPQVADAVAVPVVAAGGIADARGVVAALTLGASGVQIGTALLARQGSGASPAHRAALTTGRYTRTALTTGFTGRLARGLINRLMETLNSPGAPPLPYPLQRTLVKELTARAEAAERFDLVPMWAGQAAGLVRGGDALTYLSELVAAVDAFTWPLSR